MKDMCVTDDTDAALRDVLGDVLGLSPARRAALTAQSPLLGALPELDSMAIATLFAAIEERFDLFFDDDALSGDTIETYGTLLATIHRARAA
jgi:acyl carrier protein